MQPLLDGVTGIDNLGVIAAVGDDASTFLQGQLTNDVALMRDDQARLAAWCTAKGRMLASFIVVRRSAGEFLMVTSRDTLPATLKRLSMYVLRAKVKLRDATAEFALHGLCGSAVPALAIGEWRVARDAGAILIGLYPADGVPRALHLAAAGSARPAGADVSPSEWAWLEVRSGIATITAPVSEAFVPQMLNYESVGGVNFKKGCYPGQEVVARSQFRGTLKRRAFLAHADAPLGAGMEVFHDSDPSQPCGIVAQGAADPRGGFDAIVSLQLSAVEGGTITAGSAGGPALAVSAPPYPLLADV